MCAEGLNELCPQPYHQRPQVEGDVAGSKQVDYVLMMLSIIRLSFMSWFYYIYVYKFNIDEYNTSIFYIMYELLCVVSLDFTSGSRYEDSMDHTPCYIM